MLVEYGFFFICSKMNITSLFLVLLACVSPYQEKVTLLHSNFINLYEPFALCFDKV